VVEGGGGRALHLSGGSVPVRLSWQGEEGLRGPRAVARATRKEEGPPGVPLAMRSSECWQWLDSGGV
jgi:hypothetical protein